MKGKVIVMGVAMATLMLGGLTSCKKDYTCKCSASTAGLSISTTETINDTKSKAEDQCNEGDETGVECEIQ